MLGSLQWIILKSTCDLCKEPSLNRSQVDFKIVSNLGNEKFKIRWTRFLLATFWCSKWGGFKMVHGWDHEMWDSAWSLHCLNHETHSVTCRRHQAFIRYSSSRLWHRDSSHLQNFPFLRIRIDFRHNGDTCHFTRLHFLSFFPLSV